MERIIASSRLGSSSCSIGERESCHLVDEWRCTAAASDGEYNFKQNDSAAITDIRK